MRKVISLFCTVLIILSFSACSGPKEVTDMEYTVELCGETRTGTYSGTIVDKLPNGVGTFSVSDDNNQITYSGNWENGAPKGEAELQFEGMTLEYDGQELSGTYAGEAANGLPDGKGSFQADLEEGSFEYDGGWKQGNISGNGELKYSQYKVTFTDGTVRVGKYEGETLDGKASGTGSFTTQNDDHVTYTHSGEWKNGLPHGQGTRKWESDEYYTLEGTYTEGEFTPTPVEYYTSYGTYKSESYTLTDEMKSFIQNNAKLFLEHDLTGYEGESDNSFQYKVYSKNPAQYGCKVITVSGLSVVQIQESNYWGADHTMCILQDYNGNVYYALLYGFAEGVYEGSQVTLTAVPMAYYTYPNTAGDLIWAIACAGISVK